MTCWVDRNGNDKLPLVQVGCVVVIIQIYESLLEVSGGAGDEGEQPDKLLLLFLLLSLWLSDSKPP